ncbi:sugar ABC transporter permease [Salinisphaera sp. USBA-960]|nr:sugar ABC transporter permease [Salifodinibacter halophilus]NNC26852.1 sugar ABC transporter permease [Salifodinibacter halophilus]
MDSRFHTNRAWLLVLPAALLLFFNALVPFMAVINYSFQEVYSPTAHLFVGWEHFVDVMHDPDILKALGRQSIFTAVTLAIEIPLGIAVSLTMPRGGRWSGLILVFLALPLMVPWNIVGFIWEVFGRSDIGLLGNFVNNTLGIHYNYATDGVSAWVTLILMDIWHWTSLVALLSYAGLCAIPGAFYQAARIDGASRLAVFRHIELPKLKGVLTIALILRFIYSFKIYAAPFLITGGGPGDATTFLTQILQIIAINQLNVGRAGAFGTLYFLIILLISYLFYILLTRSGTVGEEG